VPVFTLAKIMGTSVRIIERHYGALLDGAGDAIVGALDALDAERDQEDNDKGAEHDMTATPNIQKMFGVVTIAGKKCSSRGCGGDPVAAAPWRTPERPAGSVLWACSRHADAMIASESLVADQLKEISSTCGAGDDTSCGAAATHLAVVGVLDEGGEKVLGLLSVCDRHAQVFG
jgi:hypothetical protein